MKAGTKVYVIRSLDTGVEEGTIVADVSARDSGPVFTVAISGEFYNPAYCNIFGSLDSALTVFRHRAKMVIMGCNEKIVECNAKIAKFQKRLDELDALTHGATP